MSVDSIKERLGKYPYLDIGEGWYPLVIQLDAKLAEIDPDYTLAQVKEKFGGLRYYVDTVNASDDDLERFRELVREAEAASYTICDVCGLPGKANNSGWVRTRCGEHD